MQEALERVPTPRERANAPTSARRARRTLLITEWFPPSVGGSINFFVNTYERYPDGSVWVLTGKADPSARGPVPSLPTTRVSLKRYVFLRPESLAMYVRLFKATLQLVRRHDIEVMHCGHILPEALVAYAVHRLTNVPYVIYAHGEEIGIQSRQPIKRKLMPWLFNRAQAIIANSKNSRHVLRRIGVKAQKIHVIHPAVDVDRFAPGCREDNGRVRMLSVGRLQRRKGHSKVLRALAALKDLPLEYWVAGTGEEQEYLKGLAAELDLLERVEFLGYVPDEGLPALYRSADLFVLANRHLRNDDFEGFGIVFLEAASCGRPVIAGRSGGVRDAVLHRETGILVDTEDVPALADAIRRLVVDEALRHRYGARGRRWVKDNFCWESASRSIQALS